MPLKPLWEGIAGKKIKWFLKRQAGERSQKEHRTPKIPALFGI
jgi:hypothetical protein